MKFSHAIMRKPSASLVHGITTADLGVPDVILAIQQHEIYRKTMEEMGVTVEVMDADEEFPDSVFVEDVAITAKVFACVTRPGARTRVRETLAVSPVLEKYYSEIHHIQPPGTLEGGDVMQVGEHFFIGISERTNETGALQLAEIAGNYNMTASLVHFGSILHLKTGVSYIGDNTLLICEEFSLLPEFSTLKKIVVPRSEEYAANALNINGKILIPSGNPLTKEKLNDQGMRVIEMEMSEFRKLDGGLSCLSLRF